MTNWLYKKVVFAGTFDHLHEGHKYLLRTAMKLGEKVGIGLTSDKLLEHKKNREKIQSFEKRRQALITFFEDEKSSERCQIFPIDTKEGGADTMADLEALIISDELVFDQKMVDPYHHQDGEMVKVSKTSSSSVNT
ncbi:MAG: adenylyltransferase/cytidyltransferase family protein [Candidatus Thorarchaeota archaeon]|jgi:pantetheine-phosphate adenylyltransferase